MGVALHDEWKWEVLASGHELPVEVCGGHGVGVDPLSGGEIILAAIPEVLGKLTPNQQEQSGRIDVSKAWRFEMSQGVEIRLEIIVEGQQLINGQLMVVCEWEFGQEMEVLDEGVEEWLVRVIVE